VPEIVDDLLVALGAKLVAYIAGVSETRTVREWAEAARRPTPAALDRLRLAHRVVTLGETIYRRAIEPAPAGFDELMPTTLATATGDRVLFRARLPDLERSTQLASNSRREMSTHDASAGSTHQTPVGILNSSGLSCLQPTARSDLPIDISCLTRNVWSVIFYWANQSVKDDRLACVN